MSLLRTRTDLITLALVVLLHLLLLLWLELNQGSRELARPQASRLRLIPLWLPPPAPRQASPEAPRPARRAVWSAASAGVAPAAPEVPPVAQAPASGEPQAAAQPVGPVAMGAAAPGPQASAPLDLRLPVSVARKTELSMAEQVARDPRSHSPRLTFSEKFAIALGTIECIYEELRPDGSIYRAPGRLVAKATAIVPATGKEATGRLKDTVGVCEK